jgi:hypothetical protein
VSSYNKKRSALLGENISTATHKLRKSIMFAAIVALGVDVCYRCNEKIDNIDHLSIEHKEPWQSAMDPKAAFYDLNNIAFSHLSCNVKAGTGGGLNKKADDVPCPQGHTGVVRTARGQRRCPECHRRTQNKRASTLEFKVKKRDYARTYMRKRRAELKEAA